MNATLHQPITLDKIYLFVIDCLGYVLENTPEVEGILLAHILERVVDAEFADDTNVYLVGNEAKLNNVKRILT